MSNAVVNYDNIKSMEDFRRSLTVGLDTELADEAIRLLTSKEARDDFRRLGMSRDLKDILKVLSIQSTIRTIEERFNAFKSDFTDFQGSIQAVEDDLVATKASQQQELNAFDDQQRQERIAFLLARGRVHEALELLGEQE